MTKMVTRTVKFTIVTAMAINIDTAEVTIEPYRINGYTNNEDDMLKIINEETPDNIKVVHVESYTHDEQLLGMPESLFIEMATVLPPRTTTNNEEE